MTLTIRKHVCTECGAPLIFADNFSTCGYCGTTFSVDPSLLPELEPEWDLYFCEREAPEPDFYRGGMSVRTSHPTGPNQWDYPDDVLKAQAAFPGLDSLITTGKH